MTNRHAQSLIRFLRHVVGPDGCGRDADERLLHRFARQRDQAAFAALVARHGPMVLGVCGRLLRDPNDVEDAFQATFLVLARKAQSLASPHLLAPWLYGVARRTALEAKLRAARRRAKEQPIVDAAIPDPAAQAAWADVRPVLDEEIAGLPERYRVPFVMCYLEGRTNGETARLIGCPEGTVASRLSWARQRLRARLTRRGVTLSAGVLAALLCGKTVVAPALAQCTTLAVAARVVPANVGSLAGKVLKQMLWTKVRKATGVLLTLLLVIGGGGAFVGSSRGGGEQAGREVIVARPLAREVADEEDFTGVTAVDSTEVRSRLAGWLCEVHFKDGDEVKKGQLLVVTDHRPFQADLDRAEADVAQWEINARQAAAEFEREKDPAAKKRAAAVLEEVRAALLSAGEKRDAAKATLALTRIEAPVAGRAYSRSAAGNKVRADDVVAAIVAPGPAYVDFEAPLRLLPVLAEAKAPLPVVLALSDEQGFSRKGTVSLTGARVDAEKATLRLRAVVSNDGIKPGEPARVRLATGKPYRALLVPQGAVRSEKAGDWLLIVNDKNEAVRRPVTLGPRRGDLRVVKDGLGADDWVVLDGSGGPGSGTTIAPRKVNLLAEATGKARLEGNARTVFLKDNGLSMTLPLEHASAEDAAQLARRLYPDQLAPKGRLVIRADDRSNSLAVEGTTEQVLEVVKLVAGLEELGRRNRSRLDFENDDNRVKGISAWAEGRVDWLDALYDLTDRYPASDKVQGRREKYPNGAADRGGPRLGVTVEPVSAVLVEQLNLSPGVGLLVTGVATGSPAAKLGIQANDVLVKIDGAQIPADVGDFVKLIASLKSDTPMDVIVVRKGRRQNLGPVRLADGLAPGDKVGAKDVWERYNHLKTTQDRAKVLESDVEMMKERVTWSERMVKKGYLTAQQLEADRTLLKKLEADLEAARAELGTTQPPKKAPAEKGGKPPQ
jgi:RND family efflux transporter MFP subunit